MDISNVGNLDALFQVQNNEQRQDAQEQRQVEQSNSQRDRLEFSTASRQVQSMLAGAGQTTEVRTERVDQIRNQIENGTYNVRAERVAEAIITGRIVSTDS
ncbi:MAG: flagellar biosynthesis anti-sigma factor FlgM [Acidobacteriota bacterium]